MKNLKVVKSLEDRALDAVRDLLGPVRGLQFEPVEHEPTVESIYQIDGLIQVTHAGGTYVLVVEVKRNGAPAIYVRESVS